jgi:WhiB family transcriptional regulator, redox-sensing transcriptional regulator
VASADPRDLTAIWAALSDPAARRLPATWQESAACRQADPELFFPIGSAGPAAADIQQAKAVCTSCPVQQPCLAYALASRQEFGIWGGRDENERRLLHRHRRETRIAASAERPEPTAPVPLPRFRALWPEAGPGGLAAAPPSSTAAS